MLAFNGYKYRYPEDTMYFLNQRIGIAYWGSEKVYPEPVIDDDDVEDAGGSADKDNLLRITFAWNYDGDDNRDLDTHAAMVDDIGTERYHIYHGNKMNTSYTYVNEKGEEIQAVTGLDVDNIKGGKTPNIENINWRENYSPYFSTGYIWCWGHAHTAGEAALSKGFKATIKYIKGSGNNITYHRRDYNYPDIVPLDRCIMVAIIRIENNRVKSIIDGNDLTLSIDTLPKPSSISGYTFKENSYPVRT